MEHIFASQNKPEDEVKRFSTSKMLVHLIWILNIYVDGCGEGGYLQRAFKIIIYGRKLWLSLLLMLMKTDDLGNYKRLFIVFS